MALIKCEECGNPVSDRANSCPHCGCPVEPKVEAKKCPECGQDVLEGNKTCTNCGCPIELEVENIGPIELNPDMAEETEILPSNGTTPKRKKKKLWIWLAATGGVLLAIILVVAIAFGGNNDPIVGLWEIDSHIDGEDVYDAAGMDCYAKINKDGTGHIYIYEDTYSLTWEYCEKYEDMLMYIATIDGEDTYFGLVDNVDSSEHGNLYISIHEDFTLIFVKD